MPRGYGYAVVAALGWLSLAGANQVSEQAKGGRSAPQASPTIEAIAAPSPAATVSPAPKFTPYPGYNPDPCYHAKDKDAADLCAQWRAAISAEKAAAEAHRATTWAIVATALSFIGVIGLLWTILQTQGSLAEARRANRLAMKANARVTHQAIADGKHTEEAIAIAAMNAKSAAEEIQISFDTARAQLRAYIQVHKVEIQSSGPNDVFKVALSYRNSGQTPAKSVGSYACLVMYEEGDPNVSYPDEMPDIDTWKPGSVSIVGSRDIQHHIMLLKEAKCKEVLDNVAAGKNVVICTGFIIYTDIFEE